MVLINPKRQIRGIEYPYREKINGYMFDVTPYKRIRTLGGRGRSIEIVEVVYDSQYPIDLINQILDEVKTSINDDDRYHDWLVSSTLFNKLTKEANPDYKLEKIQTIIDAYLAQNTNTVRWDKATKLLIELTMVMDDNYE